MALTTRFATSLGGPLGGTAWQDQGGEVQLSNSGTNGPASMTVTTTQPGLMAIAIVPRPNPFFSKSITGVETYLEVPDATTQTIQTLYGFQVALSTALVPNADLIMTLSVYRLLGLTNANGASGTTSIALQKALTTKLTDEDTITLVDIDADDTTTATIGPGQGNNIGDTSIAVDSIDTTAYLKGSFVTYQVGNTWAFGWNSDESAALGTPAFPANVAVIAPINTANTYVNAGTVGWSGRDGGTTAANSGGIPLQPGDVIALNVLAFDDTVTLPPCVVQLLIS